MSSHGLVKTFRFEPEDENHLKFVVKKLNEMGYIYEGQQIEDYVYITLAFNSKEHFLEMAESLKLPIK